MFEFVNTMPGAPKDTATMLEAYAPFVESVLTRLRQGFIWDTKDHNTILFTIGSCAAMGFTEHDAYIWATCMAETNPDLPAELAADRLDELLHKYGMCPKCQGGKENV